VADASAFAAAVEELAVLARRPGWVTEEPDVHLLPHLRDASVAGLRLLDYHVRDDGSHSTRRRLRRYVPCGQAG
jgi:hypothetical protein